MHGVCLNDGRRWWWVWAAARRGGCSEEFHCFITVPEMLRLLALALLALAGKKIRVG